MSDRDQLATALQNPGRLVLGPTATTGTFPFGGISLGFHRDGEAIWRTDYVFGVDPMSRRTTEVGRRGADFPEIYALLEGVNWSEDFLLAAFQQCTRGANLPFQPSETRIEGTSVPFGIPAWPPILFAANDPSHKSIYFTRPIPTLSLRQAVAISKTQNAGLPVRFVPSPTSETNIPDWQVARLENIAL